MFNLLRRFARSCTPRRAARRTRHAAGRAFRPCFEVLEDRRLPTVLFQPVYGVEHAHAVGNGIMQGPHVYPIFWGSYWASHFAQADQLTAQFQAIANLSPGGLNYLSGLEQYGAAGGTVIAGAHFDASSDPPGSVPPGFDDAVTQEIDKVLYNEPSGVPTPPQVGGPVIYALITPPNVTAPNNVVGYNQPAVHPNLEHLDPREEAWVSTTADANGKLNFDFSTSVFSHELVEATTDPLGQVPGFGGIVVSPGAAYPNANTGTQIGDNEPDGAYQYRLGGPSGPLVQAFWSEQDQQFLVRDGNSLRMQIVPDAWKKNAKGTAFFQGGTLVIDASQGGIPQAFVGKQAITIDTVHEPGGPGVRVVMDGQVFGFEPGTVNKIQVLAANDSETITVRGTLPNVPVAITLGTGKYVVNLSPAGRSDPIDSAVSIDDKAGGALTVRVAPTGSAANLLSGVSVAGAGPDASVTFTFPAGATVTDALAGTNGGALSIGSATVAYKGFAQVSLHASAGVLKKLVLTDGSFQNEQDTVTGPGGGQLWLDGGKLNYANVAELDDLVTADTATYDFTGTSLLGSPPPVHVTDGPRLINYGVYDVLTGALQQTFPYLLFGGGSPLTLAPIDYANKSNVTVGGGVKNSTIDVDYSVPADGLDHLTIDPGPGKAAVNIARVGVATTVTGSGKGPADATTVTLHDPTSGVQNILAPIDVQNPNAALGAATFLVVDDTGDATGRTVTLGDDAIHSLAPATVSWGAISGLTVDGGGANNHFFFSSLGNAPTTTLNTGAGDDTVHVDVFASSDYSLTLNGGPGSNQLFVTAVLPKTKLQQSPGQIHATTPGFPQESYIVYSNFDSVSVNQVGGLPGTPGTGGALDSGSVYGLLLEQFFTGTPVRTGGVPTGLVPMPGTRGARMLW